MSAAAVLIVEDNHATRKVMRASLQAEGYEVVEAETGRSALSLLSDLSPALVVLDCSLPDMDGFEVARQMREMVPNLPVIAVTGWAQTNESRVLAAGFLDLLVKPVQASHLVEVVARHVGRTAPQPGRAGKKILVADDDPIQRKLAHLALTRAGFEVTLAEDGVNGLRLAALDKPDAIISDVLMAGMDGFAFSQAIRSDPALARVPIVLMSAHYLEVADRELAARFGATRYVSRTDGFDAVLHALLEVIDEPVANTPSLRANDLHDLHDLPDLQAEYLRRVANQLERQARLGVGLARRVSVLASTLSVLERVSGCLAHQIDPESALPDTLAECLEAAGITSGAILLHGSDGQLTAKAYVGPKGEVPWASHSEILTIGINLGGLVIPSPEVGPAGEHLMTDLGAGSCLLVPIVARGEVIGILLLAAEGPELAGAEGQTALRAARSVALQLGQALALSRMFSSLAAAEQRYRALFEHAGDAIAVLSETGVIQEVSSGWEQILGLPRAQIVGRSLCDFATDGEDEGTAGRKEPEGAIGEGTRSAPRLMTFRRANAGVAHVELSRTLIKVAPDSYILSIGRDVGERLRFEEQLRQSQKMDAVGKLAGGIAHDFNNILTVILSYTEAMLGELKSVDPMRDDIFQINLAGKRAAELTGQLLMFSRQQVLVPQVIDLNGILARVDRMLNRILGADVDFVFSPTPGLGRMRIDPGSMEQIIMNLVVNARDAMPVGGKLTIETADVVLDDKFAQEHREVKAGPYVMLAVSDTGMGMDKTTQTRIFEPFFTTKEVGKGTGLGLSTVFGLVQQNGGTVWVYSEPGIGTTFKLYFPRVDAPLEPARVSSVAHASRGSETVLLVEDDSQVRLVTAGSLRKQGYVVLEASNAGEALLQSEKHQGIIQLLLTDVVMPLISGPELAKRLALGRPDMKILYMSGYTTDSVFRHGVLTAKVAYIQKPLTPYGLATKVREVLDAAAGGSVPVERN